MCVVFQRWSTKLGTLKLKSTNKCKSNQMLGFEERGKPEYPEKTSQCREENKQTQPKYDAESGNRTQATLVGGECTQHCASSAPCSPFNGANVVDNSHKGVLWPVSRKRRNLRAIFGCDNFLCISRTERI